MYDLGCGICINVKDGLLIEKVVYVPHNSLITVLCVGPRHYFQLQDPFVNYESCGSYLISVLTLKLPNAIPHSSRFVCGAIVACVAVVGVGADIITALLS